MKKCNRCNGIFQDKYVICPNCNIPLLETLEDNPNIKTTPIGTTKEEFQNRINQNKTANPSQLHCPKCGASSENIQIQKRGWGLLTGFIGSGKNQRVCKNCLYKW